MSEKSMGQLLAPFGVTIVLFILSYIVAIIFWIGVKLLDFPEGLAEAFELSIFDFDQRSTIVFWIINVICIIFVESWLSSDN